MSPASYSRICRSLQHMAGKVWKALNESDGLDMERAGAANLVALEDRVLYDGAPLLADVDFSGEFGSPEAQADLLSEMVQSSDWSTLISTGHEPSLSVANPTNQDDGEATEVGARLDVLNDYLDELAETSAVAERYELIVVDSSVENPNELLQQALQNSGSAVSYSFLFVESLSNGIEDIGRALSQQSVDAIHIISHGTDASFSLGQAVVTSETLSDYAGQMASWSAHLTADADILFYGCQLAESSEGEAFLRDMSELTGADVAASDDLTGHAELGGDWELEYAFGQIEASGVVGADAQQTWMSVLQTIIVDTTADVLDGDANLTSLNNLALAKGGDGLVSLREAIIAANNNAGADTIILGPGTYVLSLGASGENNAQEGDLDILEDLRIVGAGAGTTIIDGGGIDRVFHVRNGATDLAMYDLTVQGGSVNNKGGGIFVSSGASVLTLDRVVVTGNMADDGAGIYNEGTMNLTDVVISNNGDVLVTKDGGGIHNRGVAVLDRVTLSGNEADKGGGIFNDNSAIGLSLINVTVSGNTAADEGGGLSAERDITIVNSTFAFNTAADGGGIFQKGGNIVTISNTIVGSNVGTNSGPDVSGDFNSLGYNLIETVGPATGFGGTDITGVNPLLNALADNGGFGMTHALQAGSLAINPVSLTGAPLVDQRGATRDVDPDIGAYEAGAVVVVPVNTVPVAMGNTVSTTDDTPYTFQVNDFPFTDLDGDSLSSVTITSLNLAGGTLEHSGGVPVSNGDTLTAAQLGTLVYTPAQDANGAPQATFDYSVNDAQLGIVKAQMKIDVTPVNDGPSATANTVTTVEDSPYAFQVSDFTFTDVEGDSLVSVTISNLNLAGGTLEHSGGVPVSNGDTLTAAQLATLVYTPAQDASGAALATFDYVVNDADLGVVVAQMDIDVTAVNDRPSATANTVTTAEDSPYAFQVSDFIFTDVEGDSLVSVTISNLNLAGGTLEHSGGVPVSNGDTLTAAQLATLVYTPAQDASGAALATFDYSVNDADLGVVVAQMDIDVTAVNDGPSATANTVTTVEDSPYAFQVSDFTFTDIEGDSLVSVTISNLNLAGGTLEHSGGVSVSNGDTLTAAQLATLVYTPAQDASGAALATFDYAVNDADLGVIVAQMDIDVTAVNDKPLAVGDSIVVLEGGIYRSAFGEALANDLDVDGDSLKGLVVNGPRHGSLTWNANGTFVYVHNGSETTSDSFRYVISDGNGEFDVAVVSIDVTPVNDAPIAKDDVVSAGGHKTIINPGKLLANDTDVDSGSLSFVLVSGPSHGTLVQHPSGALIYVADPNASGLVTFTYAASDGSAVSKEATVTIMVGGSSSSDPPKDPVDETREEETVEDPGEPDEPSPPGHGNPGKVVADDAGSSGSEDSQGSSGIGRIADIEREDLFGGETPQGDGVSGGGHESAIYAFANGKVGAELSSLLLYSNDALPPIAKLSTFEYSAWAMMWEDLEKINEDLISAVDVSAGSVATAAGLTGVLTVGYVLWMARGGMLVASLMSSMPAWQSFDPLPILQYTADDHENDDDSLESLVSQES